MTNKAIFNLAMLGMLPLLASCAWLEPKLSLPKIVPPREFLGGGTATSGTLAFISPTEAGSWKVAEARVAEPRGNWWEMYDDAQLNSLMQEAMANNPTLQVMVARVKQARARAGLASSQLFPLIYGNGSITREKLAPAQTQQPDNAGSSAMTTNRVGLNASYELDLFGRITGEARQAKFASLAQKDLYESAKLSLQADMVQAYFAAKASDSVLADISETLKLAEKSLALAKRQQELGDISNQSYQQSVADLMLLRNDALSVQQQRLASQNQLALLLGKVPGSVVLSDTAPLTSLPPMVPAGVPASVLERRPDIAAAQNQLASANAAIGAARAAFFPSISITGNAGYAAQDMSNLFKSSTSTWAYGPALTLPIFQGATNLSNLRLSRGVYEEAVANYKQQVLSAFLDVDNALSAHRISMEQASGQMRAAEEIGRTAGMTQRQYELGDISVADYNANRQQALVARINAQNSLLNAYTASAQLVRALGGSWQNSTERGAF